MGAKSWPDFEGIFHRYFDDVYAYVAFRVAPDGEAAKDITQDVFLAAFEGLGGFRGQGSGLPWLKGIARHKVADHFRAQATGRMRPQQEREPLLSGGRSALPELDGEAVLVAVALRQIPSRYAQLLEDKYIEDLSVKEMARSRQSSEKAVESALSRARDAFRKIYRRLQTKNGGGT